jgi:uncharacterized protein
MRQYAKLFHATLTALLMLAAAGVAVAGPLEDAKTAYERGDYATALGLWLPLANQGNAEAQHGLGNMYANGDGVPQDYGEAVKWDRKAADQGNAGAQNALGDWYEYGWGATWGIPKDKVEAVEWYRRAAAQGNEWAQYHLGTLYASGHDGVPLDYVLAYMWFNLAAASGNPLPERDREQVARLMTPAQIAEAQKQAREWKPKPER